MSFLRVSSTYTEKESLYVSRFNFLFGELMFVFVKASDASDGTNKDQTELISSQL